MAEFFPERHAVSYSWYKNGEVVEGATEDDYSENKELSGEFQLHLTLDNAKVVRSNVLYINASASGEQRVTCYNELGMILFETEGEPDLSGLPSGIYFIVYESATGRHTEKLMIP